MAFFFFAFCIEAPDAGLQAKLLYFPCLLGTIHAVYSKSYTATIPRGTTDSTRSLTMLLTQSRTSYPPSPRFQADNGPRAPAAATSAAQLLDTAIARLEASLGLQPEEALAVTSVAEGTGEAAGKAHVVEASKAKGDNVSKKNNARGKGKKGDPPPQAFRTYQRGNHFDLKSLFLESNAGAFSRCSWGSARCVQVIVQAAMVGGMFWGAQLQATRKTVVYLCGSCLPIGSMFLTYLRHHGH